MSKPYFALNLDVFKKPCLVVGGDEEALEKSERLVEAGADLTVVAKRAIPPLADLIAAKGGRLELRAVEAADIAGKFFVLNCVKSEPALSAWIYEESLRQHALISAYDQPQASNAVMMALVRAGRLRITVASNGSSPGLVSAVRKALERLFDANFARYSESVAEQRQCQVEKGSTPESRKARFRAQLREFDIKGEIVYPSEYRKNLECGVERRLDGLYWRKDGPGREAAGAAGAAGGSWGSAGAASDPAQGAARIPDNRELIERAKAAVKPRKIRKHTSGDVGCALLAGDGSVHLGICVDVPCGIGFCAEHSAIASLVTSGQQRILKIVAVQRDGTVLPPCGRCRELMRLLDESNMDTEVVLGPDRSASLRELLPNPW